MFSGVGIAVVCCEFFDVVNVDVGCLVGITVVYREVGFTVFNVGVGCVVGIAVVCVVGIVVVNVGVSSGVGIVVVFNAEFRCWLCGRYCCCVCGWYCCC